MNGGPDQVPWWLNPFHSEYQVLGTRLSPEDCRDRLQARVGSHSSKALFYECSRPLVGWAANDAFDLSRCVPYKNVYRTWAKGKLSRSGDRTLISSRTAVSHPSLAGSLVILAGALAFLALFGLRVALIDLLIAGWLGSVILRLHLARGDRAFLLQSLRDSLQAEAVEGPLPAPGDRGPVDARRLYRTLPGHRVPVWYRLIQAAIILLVLGKLVLVGLVFWKQG